MRDRHLAGAETAELYAVLKVIQALVDAGLTIACRNDHAIFALEAGGAGFSKFHRHHTYAPRLPVLSFARTTACWCGRRGSNPHDFRHGNLNPARLPIPPRPRTEGRPGGAAYNTRHPPDTIKIARASPAGGSRQEIAVNFRERFG